MKEEDIDKILKDQINKNNIKAPESLKIRISNEIKNIKDNKSKNKTKKSILKVMQSIAAVAVISILGVTTYATVTKNPILEKLGLLKGSITYEEVAKEINEDLSNEYANITLKRMASDNAYIIMEYNVVLTEKEIPKFGELELDFVGDDISIENTIKINNEEVYKMEYVNKLSENEYDVFQIIQIADIESEHLKIEISEKYLYLMVDKNYIEINKEVVIDATKSENAKLFKNIEKKIGNKTITVESFQNTTFETFIKVSVDISNVEKSDLELADSEKNPNNIFFTVLDQNNNYIPNICYVKKSLVEDEFGNKLDILSGYDENNNLSYNNAKAHLEYIITLGDIDKEINELKLVPYISIFHDEKIDDYEDYYNNLDWHKLQSGDYIQKNTLGGEIELTKMEVNSEKIKFSYNLRGFLTSSDVVLLRINDEKLGFNVIFPNYISIQNINNEENSSEFYRSRGGSGLYSDNFKDEEDYKLKDISKIEFALLAEPKIKLLDSEIELTIPEEKENYLIINKIETKEIHEEKSNTDNQNVINEIIDLKDSNNTINNIVNDNTNNIITQQNTEENSKERVFGKEDNKIGKIKLGMTENEVKSALGEPLNIIDNRNTNYINKLIYEYTGEMNVSFKEENGKYLVYQINTYKLEDIGPRGVKIGDKKEEIVKKFYCDKNINLEEMFVQLYGAYEKGYYGEITITEEEYYIEYSGDKMLFMIYLNENGNAIGMSLGEILD